METCEVAARSQTLAIEALEVGIEGTFTRPVLRCVFSCVLFCPGYLKRRVKVWRDFRSQGEQVSQQK